MKDKHFIDWESSVFGFGYGTGEIHTLKALKGFFENILGDGAYNHEVLEEKITPTVAWLMINILCHADIIEYGTSPRYGWLTEKGRLLKKYLENKTVDELYGLTANTDKDYIHCYPTHCNCGEPCHNPLFTK